MSRRRLLFCVLSGLLAGPCARPVRAAEVRPPNIVFMLADDLGYAELGSYGQKRIKTPNLDRVAASGMRFTQAYSSNPVCAPSRCAFLTGKHCGHSFIRDNSEVGSWDSFRGQLPIPEGLETIATMLKRRGYATACIGKWGLGAVGSTGDPNRQGFDLFFGYNCQRHAHNYYPKYLWRNREKVVLEGNDRGLTGARYAPDVMAQEALRFIEDSKDRPFFLYYATTVPHVALQVPEDSLAEYNGAFEETPYDGSQGYLPHPTPRAAYAAMVTRMDHDAGRLIRKLERLGLRERTLFVFTSDNGPTFNGGSDSAFFESAGLLRGLKCSLYEGGIRVPFIASWPGRIPAGATSDLVTAHYDMMATFAEAAGAVAPAGTDGISILPALLGSGPERVHEYLYWERPGTDDGGQALRRGRWKGIRIGLRKDPDAALQLFDLEKDLGETRDAARDNPEVAATLLRLMREAHTDSAEFPLFGKKAP